MRLLADDRFGGSRERNETSLPEYYDRGFRAMLAQDGRLMLAEQDGVVVGCLRFNFICGVSQLEQSRAQHWTHDSIRKPLAMSPQKKLLLQIANALTANDFDHVAQWFTNDFRLHDPDNPDWPIGHKGARQMLTVIRDKVSGVKVEILDMLEEGDRVAVRWLFLATREGEPRHLSAVGIYRFTDGLISEDWGIATGATWP